MYMIERICEECGEIFCAQTSEVNKGKRKFCSHSCSNVSWHRNKGHDIGLSHAEQANRYWDRHPGKKEAIRKKCMYGLSTIDYYIMLEIQGYQCAICGNWLDLGIKTHIDHIKGTKSVRGILCQGCNIGIGGLKHNIVNLQNAIVYLGG